MGCGDSVDAPASLRYVGGWAVACRTVLDRDGGAAGELSSLVERFQQLRCRLEAAEASVLSRWDAAKAYRLDGAKTAAAWLGWKHNLPAETARQRVRHEIGRASCRERVCQYV